jgi:hypothetical protein
MNKCRSISCANNDISFNLRKLNDDDDDDDDNDDDDDDTLGKRQIRMTFRMKLRSH